MQLIWHQRHDGLWNAACACNASVCGVEFARRADAEAAHFDLTDMERAHRASHPERFAGNQIPACGPKLPDPNLDLRVQDGYGGTKTNPEYNKLLRDIVRLIEAP